MSRARRVGIVLLAAMVLAAVLAPTAALAAVQPFATNMPGGSGTGGGVGELWPIGFGFVTAQNGTAWGDGAGDTYQALTRTTTWITGTDPAGGPQRLLAFVNKNPAVNKPYIKLKKNGVDVAGFDAYVQTPSRNSAIIVPNYLSLYPIFYPGAPQNNAWFIPISGFTFDPGCAYELRFLKGMKANNGLTCVDYTDPVTGLKMGYIQNASTAEEVSQYNAKQYDTFQFRNANVPASVGAPYGYGDQIVTDESKRWEDFTFKFQTYADLTDFQAALAAAQEVVANEKHYAGHPQLKAELEAVVAEAGAVTNMWLQTDVDAMTAKLEAATAAVQGLNYVPRQPASRPIGGHPDTPPGQPDDRPPFFSASWAAPVADDGL